MRWLSSGTSNGSLVPASSGIVWIVDDDPGMRRSLRMMLGEAGLEARAFDGASAFLDEFERGEADCLILDLQMPEVDGLTLAKQLRDDGLGLPIIMLSGQGTIPAAVQAMQLGALDFMEKPANPGVLISKVRAALAQDRANRSRRQTLDEVRKRVEGLTGRERDLLDLIVQGQANKQIAATLGIAEKTVANHRARLMEKMCALNAADLSRMVVEMKEAGGSRGSPGAS